MKVFTNKKIKNKIIGALLVIMLFNFIMPTRVRADDSGGGLGGALLQPILDLLVVLGDGVMGLIHHSIYDTNEILIRIDFSGSLWQILITIGAFIIGAALAIIAIIATAGLATAIVSALGVSAVVSIGAGTLIIGGLTGGTVGAYVINNTVLPDNLYLPVYLISPYEIFRGNVPTFDVNFFKDYGDEKGTKSVAAGNETVTDYSKLISIANALTNFLKDDLTDTAKNNGNIKDDYKKIVEGKRGDGTDAIYGNLVNALKDAETNPSTFDASNFFAEYNIGNVITYMEAFVNDPNPSTYIKREYRNSKK